MARSSAPLTRRDRTHWLYLGVVVAAVAGVIVGLIAPGVGTSLGFLGTLFVNLIKMMIAGHLLHHRARCRFGP